MKLQRAAVGDRVCDRCDQRHVGRVHMILAGVALVQFGWRGRFTLLRVSSLIVVERRAA